MPVDIPTLAVLLTVLGKGEEKPRHLVTQAGLGKRKRVLCEHGRERNLCKDCGGASICEHRRQRKQCKDCGGSSICEHGRHRSTCKDCGGSSRCEHGRQRNACIDCRGVMCVVCGENKVLRYGPHEQTCKPCRDVHPYFIAKREKWEEIVVDTLKGVELVYERTDAALPCKQVGRKKSCRPDFVFTLSDESVLVLEIDESYHKHYNIHCENARMIHIKEGLGGAPLRILRVHPTKRSIAALPALIRREMEDTRVLFDGPGMEVVYFNYPDWRIEELKEEVVQELGALPWSMRSLRLEDPVTPAAK